MGGGGGGAPGAPNNGGGGAGTGGGGIFAVIELDWTGDEGGNGWTMRAPMLCKLEIFASSGIEDPTCFMMSSSLMRLTDSTFNCKLQAIIIMHIFNI